MAAKQLSAAQVRNAKPADKEYLLADGDGLFLRVRPSGAREWLLIYSFAGKRPKIALGSLDVVSLADARLHADKIRSMLAQGLDPQLERLRFEAAQVAERKAIEDEHARITVGVLFERWAAVDLVRRRDGGAEVRRMFEKDVLPTLGTMPVELVSKGHITGLTDALLARGVPRMAKVIFSLIRQMFRFAVDRDIIGQDPTASIRKAKIGGADVERDRVLSEDEIRALARQTPSAGLLPQTEAAIWLALATCCRIGELLSARWTDLDFERAAWTIPAEHSKNGRPHRVALSPFALEHFRLLRAATTHPEWVYPNRSGKGPVCSKTVTKQLGDRQRRGLAPMQGRAGEGLSESLQLLGGRWTPHDLRRTGATLMVSLGVLPEVAERCLNHVEENKIKRTYQRHSYEREMRAAWALLGDRLALLTRADADNVVSIRAA